MLSENQKKILSGIIKKPHVNASCIGCSACVAISGDVFELNDDGLSTVVQLPTYEGYDVDDSIAACPVSAISWQEAEAETGEYLGNITEHDQTHM